MPEETILRGPALVDAVRDMIIRGELAPGSRVTEPALASAFNVSRVPIREAVRALAAEGFVELRHFGSPTVMNLTERVVHEVRTARAVLEPHATRLAATQRSDADLAAIREILDEGDRAIDLGQMDRLHRLNSRFHDAVASASGNSVLGGFVHQLSARSEWINTASIPVDNRFFWRDHRDIYDAIEARDADRAESLMAEHVRRAATQPGAHDTGGDDGFTTH
ncbi:MULTISPECIES: GntR family transcriptional regulator [Microbacterium]|uniref:GntR family transcriptional regulator n=1 Tax=Microbacterium TaxID=33882 RepID=UPI0018E1DC73|nr:MULTISPECIES: GntR family transcriptional regulator [Microbacterium]